MSTTAAAPTPASAGEKAKFLATFAREHATTLKVLRAMPAKGAEIKPHDLSRTARELAWTFCMEQKFMMAAMTDQMKFGAPMPAAPASLDAVIKEFEADFPKVVALAEGMSPQQLSGVMQFPVGPGKMGDFTKMDFMWFTLYDQVHHRGQMSVYLRMAGGKVPSIYGPTADEPWM